MTYSRPRPGEQRWEVAARAEITSVLAAVVRRYGRFDLAEDAVQDALIKASTEWPARGVPDRPRAWLIRVAGRAMVDALRSEQSRRAREERHGAPRDAPVPGGHRVEEIPSAGDAADDSLVVLFACCHPALSSASQLALILRAVGGLTTDEIGRALLVPSTTVGQRISRAKAAIVASGVPFAVPGSGELEVRLPVVLRAVYLVFNEGYVASSGDELTRVELSSEAIRLGRLLHAAYPERGEVTGLLALMLLTEARRPARIRDGAPVPVSDQDRSLWDRSAIAEGVGLAERAMTQGPLGTYQVQAAIAAVHDEAVTASATDWAQILGLYSVLIRLDPSPMVRVARVVATARVHGPQAGLHELDEAVATAGASLVTHHRVLAVRAHLLADTGQRDAARDAFLAAARATLSIPERRHLLARAEGLS